jgi:hypothetical protein
MSTLLRIPPHAVQDLHDRDISVEQVEKTLEEPDAVGPRYDNRMLYFRRYYDLELGQEMLLRVVTEETEMQRVVVTGYKTSKIKRYSKG